MSDPGDGPDSATEPNDASDGDEPTADDEEGLTYADAGVDVDASEAATAALVDAAGEFEGDYAGLVDLGDAVLGLATDGVGTKLLVAEAMDDYSTVGIDCVAMNVNDLIAAGLDPVAFVDYLAVAEPNDRISAEIGEGLRAGVEQAGAQLVGGETAVMPEVVKGLDVAGTCAGVAPPEALFPSEAAPGDALVGWPSSGIHSNGLTLARQAVTRDHDYTDPFPPAPERAIGDELLTPTRIYADALEPLREHEARGVAHITGGGWTNLFRLGDHRYEVTDPLPAQDVFGFVQDCGDVTDAEMHRTFNMGTGLVAAMAPERADALLESVPDATRIGRVEAGDRAVGIRDLVLD